MRSAIFNIRKVAKNNLSIGDKRRAKFEKGKSLIERSLLPFFFVIRPFVLTAYFG